MKCSTKFCRRVVVGRCRYCTTCKYHRWKHKNPERYAYKNLRFNSLRRGIEFSLTFEQFVEFCYKTRYIAGKGRSGDSLSIDRIDNTRGYTIDNIQVLTKSQNSSKGTKHLVYDYRRPEDTTVVTVQPIILDNSPF